jgi:hypothetical protein
MCCRGFAVLFLLAFPAACATSRAHQDPPPPAADKPPGDARLATNRRKAPVYLSELSPLYVTTHTSPVWGFGNHGLVGARLDGKLLRIAVNGKTFQHSLGAHPPLGGVSRVVYVLGRRFKTLFGSVGISDTGGRSGSPLTFEILGGGKSLWRSKPIDAAGRLVEFGVDVRNTDRLALVVHCPGSNHGAHAVWIEPRLERNPNTRSR